jgi:hypothetical protein
MPLDVLEADLVRLARDGVDGAAPRHVDAQGLKLDLIVKVLQRDDPLRRSYLQRRWHGHPTSVPLAWAVGRYNFGCTSLSQIVLSRR